MKLVSAQAGWSEVFPKTCLTNCSSPMIPPPARKCGGASLATSMKPSAGRGVPGLHGPRSP